MLARNSYPLEYIAAARRNVATQIEAYHAMAAGSAPGADGYLAAFEPTFFATLLVMLDGQFTDRARALEGTDGNALNEVRVLCASITGNGRRLAAGPIKLDPAKTVLGLRIGDEIKLTERDFIRLTEAYFAELERRYPEPAG